MVLGFGARRPTWLQVAQEQGRPRTTSVREPWLTQWGGRKGFNDAPRFDGPGSFQEYELSMTQGVRTCEDMTRLVCGRPMEKKDRVRFFVVADLELAAYAVSSTPEPGNPDHVSVTPAGLVPTSDEAKAWWSNPPHATLTTLAHEDIEGVGIV